LSAHVQQPRAVSSKEEARTQEVKRERRDGHHLVKVEAKVTDRMLLHPVWRPEDLAEALNAHRYFVGRQSEDIVIAPKKWRLHKGSKGLWVACLIFSPCWGLYCKSPSLLD